jgi:adenosylcobinamide-phosphate synthase
LGRFAIWIELRLNGGAHSSLHLRIYGLLAWSIVIAPWLLLIVLLWQQPVLQPVVGVLILYFTLGMQSLGDHASRIQTALETSDLTLARQRVGDIVSRDTAAMQPEDVTRAAVESVLENGNDAVFAALFWFAVAGAPGVLLYRLANTLDAMWGYRTPRFFLFRLGGCTHRRCAELYSRPPYRTNLRRARPHTYRVALLAATGCGVGQPQCGAGHGERRG